MITTLPQWQALKKHQQEIASVPLRDLVNNDPQRFKEFSISAANIIFDYSKNHINKTTLSLLLELAQACELKNHITALFSGEKINITEQRAALHIALRDIDNSSSRLYDPAIHDAVIKSLQKITAFVNAIHTGKYCGYSGKPITDIINIGIGGSDLGPAMVTHALTPYHPTNLRFHFISNLEDSHRINVLKQLNPETSLFIVSSKSLTTQETLINTQTIQQWFKQQTKQQDLSQHFVAVTANEAKARELGINAENIFPVWDWVGGRYSLWSAIGLPIALAIGMEHFKQLLHGAHKMDQHFYQAPFSENMPVIAGLLDIWYYNFFHSTAHAILPYTDLLQSLPAYLQQAAMESNGKSVTCDNQSVDYATGPIIFGAPGTNGQHAFHQWLHQSQHLIPVDFIIPLQSFLADQTHHVMLVANAFAQSKALMDGKLDALPYKILPGNKPSNLLLFKQLTPATLGALLAFYEHKIFVQSAVWNINAFDQWGVEYGKQLANSILPALLNQKEVLDFDPVTDELIRIYRKL